MNDKSGLYLCMFEDGTLKVGRASNINIRLKSIKSCGERFGIFVKKVKFVNCLGTAKAEAELIKWCKTVCTKQSCREWFKGVDFEECLSMAISIAEIHGNKLPVIENIDLKIDRFFPKTRTEDAYQHAKTRLLKEGYINKEAFECFDFLHVESEAIRRGLTSGALAPEWFKKLNVFMEWEEEMFFLSEEDPNASLIRACSDSFDEIYGIRQ